MISKVIPLRFKVAAYSTSRILKRWLGTFCRRVPFLPKLLGVPNGKIHSTKDWVDRNRQIGATYTQVFPKTCLAPVKPNRLGSHGVIKPPVPRTDGKVFPYWDIRSGFDARQGFFWKSNQEYDEAFLASIPNGRVLGPSGAILASTGELFVESIWTWGNWVRDDRSQVALHLPRAKKLDGPIYVIASNECEGFPHWLTEVLPRLYGLKFVQEETPPALVTRKPLKPWQLESLQLLGLESYKVIVLAGDYLESPKVYFPSYVGKSGRPHPLVCRWLRETMVNNFTVSKGPKRIYISRRIAGRRRILNEDELVPILEEYGFEIILAEKFTLSEQVALFSNAEIVVTIHGAGLANLLFVPETCKVLELLERTFVSDYYYNLASALSLEYYYDIFDPWPSKTKLPQGYDDIVVAPEQMRRDLDVLIAKTD